MALTAEWRRRVDQWRMELGRHFYRRLGGVDLEGFVTKEQYSYDEAMRMNFKPVNPGTPWGAKWEYGWFRGSVVLPEEAKGKRIVLKTNVGAESAVYINGKNAGASDYGHHEITLTKEGKPGERYEIGIEGYAGHGRRVWNPGPTPPGRATVPEPGPTQAVVGDTSFGIWDEDVYQLWLDVETLYHVRNNIDENSLRVSEIDEGLMDFTLIVDFELPYEGMLKSVVECRSRLKPLLEKVNGSTVPVMFTFGHSHIDVAWLWPLAETERKCARTFSTQLALMEEYPEYKFLQSQPHLYRMTKRLYPELYKRIKEAVKRGQFIPEGGMWVEADTNISGGESLIRQFIHGKRFFRDEFGVESEMLWLPDVFGYSGNMPQIMRGCGIKYFATAKIFWTYNGGEPFPYNTFTWEGIDGSGVLVHLCNDYNSSTDPTAVIQRWSQRVQKNGISTRLFPFGHGDGGGGAAREHLEYLRRQKNLEGVPMTRMSHPLEFFKDQEKRGIPKIKYVGELYFQEHRGTYTSQARTKRGNRKSEFALREAEMWGAAARALAGFSYPVEDIDEAWKIVLLNQFHDILPGSSIHRVYEEAEAAYKNVIDTANKTAKDAAALIADNGDALTVFNSLSWDRRVRVSLPEGFDAAVDSKGERLPIFIQTDGRYTEVKVPSCGWTTIKPLKGGSEELSAAGPSDSVKASASLLENDLLRIELNDKGEILSIFDKEIGKELAAGICNSIKMYKDVPNDFDAWDINSMYTETPVELPEKADIEVVADGPYSATIRVSRRLNNSMMTQEITLSKGSRRVEFDTTIDWQESHKLLKVAFPVNIHANEAVHEIQFGHLKRPNHKSRPFDAERFEVANQKWSALMEENRGCAILNDCKYGVNVLGNSINLTLLKSALAPDMTADKGMQRFKYAFYAWNGSFAESDLIREAYELNVDPIVLAGDGGERSLFGVDAPNVIIDTVKPAEDGSGDVIVRLYESKRMTSRCRLSTALSVIRAKETDMLENEIREIELKRGLIKGNPGRASENGPKPDSGRVGEVMCSEMMLDFTPFEIKTLRLAVKR